MNEPEVRIWLARPDEDGEEGCIVAHLCHVILWEGKSLSGHHRLIAGEDITGLEFLDADADGWGGGTWRPDRRRSEGEPA